MNTIEISYDNDTYMIQFPLKETKAFLNKVCAKVGLANCEFSVSIIDEDHMHQLNKEYRNIDDSTDILSFAVEDNDDGFDFIVPTKHKRNIGDMLICPQVMARNAQYFNVPVEEEAKRLLIHGVLHLCGENHQTNDMSEPMLIKQEEILKSLTAL